MKPIKVSEATELQLNWLVAKCEGKVEQGVYGIPEFRDGGTYLHYCDAVLNDRYEPSTNWSQGGPIIERERIAIDWDRDVWNAAKDGAPLLLLLIGGFRPSNTCREEIKC